MNAKEFINEFAKNKIQLSLSQESEWMQYFKEETEKIQNIKEEIKLLENEVDQIVYQMYGLTEDEIKIVEA